jgi:hypothetical protein
MKFIRQIFNIGYSTIAILFFCCAIVLIVFAVFELWGGIRLTADLSVRERFNAILESIGLLTIAVAALELGQTVLEEEVLRETHVSTPTRVRRFLSRFMIVIVVSLGIESLIAVFQLVHDDPERLPQASLVAFAAAGLLAAWGIFLKLNRSVEELEPEAMEEAKQEDQEIKK